jgi:hypothetical protein
MEAVLNFFLKAISEVRKRHYLLIIAVLLNVFFIFFWQTVPTFVDFKKPIYYVLTGAAFILIFNYFVVSHLLIIIADYIDQKHDKEAAEPITDKDKGKLMHKIFSEYSDIDKRELLNLVVSIEEMNKILQDRNIQVDIPLSNLSVLWREKTPEDKKKKKPLRLKRGQNIWTTVFGRDFLDNGDVVKNKLLKDFLSIFEKVVEDIYESLDGDLSESRLILDLFVVFILLKKLDKNDICPSVVDKFAGDSDKNKQQSNYFELEKFRDASSLRSVNAYDILSNITLVEHSVNVALWTLRYIFENNYGYPIIISAVLVAFAHDIGKIPEIYEEELARYTTTDHPYASANYLKKLTTFSSIPNERMKLIEESILRHHGKIESKSDAQNIFHEILKKADHNAREMEIQAYQQSQGKFINDELPLLKVADFDFPLGDEESVYDDEQDEDEINILALVKSMQRDLKLAMVEKFSTRYGMIDLKRTSNQEEQNVSQSQPQNQVVEDEDEQEIKLNDEQQQSDTNKNKIVSVFKSSINYDDDISNITCINDEFINNILKRIVQKINRVSLNNGGQSRYNAFSFKDTVFVTSYFIKKSIKEELESLGCTELTDIINKEQREYKKREKEAEKQGIPISQIEDNRVFTKKLLQYVIIDKIKKEYDLINTNYVKDNFYGGYFEVYLKNGETLSETKKTFYVPFKIDVFKKMADLAEIENRKEQENNIFRFITEVKFATNSKKDDSD